MHPTTHRYSRRKAPRALLLACALALCLPAAAAGSVAPLPTAEYQTRHVCPPPALGRASCLAVALTPKATSAAATAPSALTRSGIALDPLPLGARTLGARTLGARTLGPLPPGARTLGPLPPGARTLDPQRPGAPSAPAAVQPSYAAGQNPKALEPKELLSAYDLPAEPPTGSPTQTIALVDAYNDPSAATDLDAYDGYMKLLPCTVSSGCFTKLNQSGESAEGTHAPFPRTVSEREAREAICKRTRKGESTAEKREKQNACFETEEAAGWTVEISTDVDVAHSLCPTCHILLVEANSTEYTDLEAAEETAAQHGATEISNSWSGSEPPFESPAFEHPGLVITAAAGDDGYLNWTQAKEAEAENEPYYSGAGYPASSPHVVAVGGTELTVAADGARNSETVWNEDPNPEGANDGAGGGGCSTQFSAPLWQREVPNWSSVGCGTGTESKRAVADVAADADPYSGVLVYDSEESTTDYLQIGGTSVASPIVASVFALAGGAHGVAYPAQTLYSNLGSPSLFDVTEGGNGACDALYTSCSGSMSPLSPLSPLDCGKGVLICDAAPGYDGPTGVGAPNGIAAFKPGTESEEEKAAREALEAKRAKEEEATHAKEKAAKEAEEAKEAKEAKERETREAQEAKELKEAREAQQIKEAREALEAREKGAPETVQTREAREKAAKEAAEKQQQGSGLSTGTPAPTAPGDELGLEEEEIEISPAGPGAHQSSSHSGATGVRLSGLALTARATAALANAHPTLSQVAFRFTLNAPARVRVALAKRVAAKGRLAWTLVSHAPTLTAPKGHDHSRLHSPTALPPGRYRLTLTPAGAAPRAIIFLLR